VRTVSCTTREAIGATTAGTFHIAEGGLPVPADKVSVPLPGVRQPVP